MRYSVTIFARSMMPERGGRLLVSEPRTLATLSAIEAWLLRSAGTWCSALGPTESGWTGAALDADGSEALVLEFGRDPDVEPTRYDRAELRAMKAARHRTTTTRTTEGKGSL